MYKVIKTQAENEAGALRTMWHVEYNGFVIDMFDRKYQALEWVARTEKAENEAKQ